MTEELMPEWPDDWNTTRWRVALIAPRQNYGKSLLVGALVGLSEFANAPVSIWQLDEDLAESELNKAAKLEETLPHVVLGVIRSNIAAKIQEFCSEHKCIFIATDNAATRFDRRGHSAWHFYRVTRVTEQMVGAAVRTFSQVRPGPQRLYAIASAYAYGDAIIEDLLRRIVREDDLMVGVVGTDEIRDRAVSGDANESELVKEAKMIFERAINELKPDAVLVGSWGAGLEWLLSRVIVPSSSSLGNTPLVIPDAGWDRASDGIRFQKGSVIGGRYFLDASGSELGGPRLIEYLRSKSQSEVAPLHYQAASAYSGATLIAGLMSRLDPKNAAGRTGAVKALREQLVDESVNLFSGCAEPEEIHFRQAGMSEFRAVPSSYVAVVTEDHALIDRPTEGWQFWQMTNGTYPQQIPALAPLRKFSGEGLVPRQNPAGTP